MNAKYVLPFARTNIYGASQEHEETHENTMWKSSYIKYKPITKNVSIRKVKPAGDNRRKTKIKGQKKKVIPKIRQKTIVKKVKRDRKKYTTMERNSETPDFEDDVPLNKVANALHQTVKKRTTRVNPAMCFRHMDFSLSEYETDPDYLDDGLLGIHPIIWSQRRKGTDATWKKIYSELNKAVTFLDLTKVVNNLKEIPQLPAPSEYYDKSIQYEDQMDGLSQEILKDFLPDYTKICCSVEITGDGNCFPRTLSRLVYGNQSHHNEMRCRIVIDSVKNFSNYVDHEYLMRGTTYCSRSVFHLGSQYCHYSAALGQMNTHLDSTIRSTLEKELLGVRRDKVECGIWQIHSAANVLKRNVFVIFPSEMKNLQLDMQRYFLPHDSDGLGKIPLNIMWTKCSRESRRLSHFVPLIPW
jgi:hypothetical protein